MGQNQEDTPNRRPKSAPMLTRDEMEGAGSPYKTSTPLALYASLSRAGHFQGTRGFPAIAFHYIMLETGHSHQKMGAYSLTFLRESSQSLKIS